MNNSLGYCIEQSKISVDAICKGTGVTKANLTKYIEGKALPNVETAIKIAHFLGLKVEDIW